MEEEELECTALLPPRISKEEEGEGRKKEIKRQLIPIPTHRIINADFPFKKKPRIQTSNKKPFVNHHINHHALLHLPPSSRYPQHDRYRGAPHGKSVYPTLPSPPLASIQNPRINPTNHASPSSQQNEPPLQLQLL